MEHNPFNLSYDDALDCPSCEASMSSTNGSDYLCSGCGYAEQR